MGKSGITSVIMNVRIHIFVSGKVQGVFFRSSMRKEAQQLDVRGWVKNLPDGRVEAVLEGAREEVNELIKWCSKGPDYARVIGTQVEEEDYSGEFRNFSILR